MTISYTIIHMCYIFKLLIYRQVIFYFLTLSYAQCCCDIFNSLNNFKIVVLSLCITVSARTNRVVCRSCDSICIDSCSVPILCILNSFDSFLGAEKALPGEWSFTVAC